MDLQEISDRLEITDLITRYTRQVDISLQGGAAEARATAYFTNPMVDYSGRRWEVGGYDHHELVRTPDGRRSRRMVDDSVWSRGL